MSNSRRMKQDGLSLEQKKAIDLLVWTDKLKTEIAAEIGVNRVTLYRWYQNEQFVDELNRQRKIKFTEAGDVAQKELMRLLTDSSDKRTQLQAIKLVLGENGFCSDKLQVTQKTSENIVVTFFDDDDTEDEN